MADNQTYEILIRFGLDDANAKKAVASIKQVEAASDAAGKKTTRAAQSGALFKDVAAYALKTAAAYVSIGAAISFISSAVNQYVQRAGYTEAASRGWLLATQDIQSATDDIGKIVAEKVLPLYKELAAFIKGPVVDAIKEAANAADLLNKGPGIIKDTITEHEKNLKASDTTYKDYSAEYDRNFVLKMLAFMGTSGLKDVFQAITDPTGAKGTKGGLWLAQNKKMS
jgi:hypothetical protein